MDAAASMKRARHYCTSNPFLLPKLGTIHGRYSDRASNGTTTPTEWFLLLLNKLVRTSVLFVVRLSTERGVMSVPSFFSFSRFISTNDRKPSVTAIRRAVRRSDDVPGWPPSLPSSLAADHHHRRAAKAQPVVREENHFLYCGTDGGRDERSMSGETLLTRPRFLA